MGNKFKSLILVTDKSQLGLAYNLYNTLTTKGKSPLIFSTCDNITYDKGFSLRTLKDYQADFKIDYAYIKQEAHNLFHALANLQTSEGISLRELTVYNGVSLWDLSSKYALWELCPFLYYINLFNLIFEAGEYLEVHIINEKGNQEEIIKLICNKKKIPFFIHKRQLDGLVPLKKFIKKKLNMLRQIKTQVHSLYFLLSNFIKSFKHKKYYKVIFFAPFERVLNTMLPVMLDCNLDECLVINMDDPASARKLKKNKIFYTEFSGYRLSNLFKRITAVVMRNIRCAVYESNSFLAKETYNSLPIGWLLSDLLEKVFDEEFPRKAQEIDAIRKIILTYKPKVIVIRDCFFNISIIAKSMSIPVVAMQTSHADEFIFPARVVADAMTVDGNYWKEYLERNAVDPSRIWITGSPKFDILHNNGFGYKNSDLKLELDKSKKLIVFATSYSALALGMLEYERTSHIHSLFSAVKNIKDVHLIVKLHPFEKDISTYRKIAHSVGLLNYSVVNNIDILDLLYKSDLLVTYFSTTAYEAVLMNKNVILLNSNSNFNPVDFWDFKRYGVAICADSPQKLEGYIRKALFDPETISCLNAKRKEYIFDHAYRIDGKATERVREVISRFI